MTIFLTSDSHFGHANMLLFKRPNGEPVRPFASTVEVDSLMIDQWIKVVKPTDHVYHLGDVAMHRGAMDAILPLLPGHKRLIRGNHDIFKTKMYLKHFEEVMAMRVFDGRGAKVPSLLLTHIPIHPSSLKVGWVNVHGHVHANDPHPGPYLNVCVERTGYAPVALEDVQQWAKKVVDRPSGFAPLSFEDRAA